MAGRGDAAAHAQFKTDVTVLSKCMISSSELPMSVGSAILAYDCTQPAMDAVSSAVSQVLFPADASKKRGFDDSLLINDNDGGGKKTKL